MSDTDLVVFLKARVEEEAETARRVNGLARWQAWLHEPVQGRSPRPDPRWAHGRWHVVSERMSEWGAPEENVAELFMEFDDNSDPYIGGEQRTARHIALQDPEAVIARCGAMLNLIFLHTAEEAAHECPEVETYPGRDPEIHTVYERDCPTLKTLAMAYSGHPDWKGEWLP